MPRILPAIASALAIATASLSAQQHPAEIIARQLALRSTAAIQGTAFNATNGILANAAVRVRDARLGRIVSQSLTDKMGAYAFKGLDPGNYIVEIVSNNQTTLAATHLISANAGETVTAAVKLPFKPSMLGTILSQQGESVATPAASPISAATALPNVLPPSIPIIVPVGPPVTER